VYVKTEVLRCTFSLLAVHSHTENGGEAIDPVIAGGGVAKFTFAVTIQPEELYEIMLLPADKPVLVTTPPELTVATVVRLLLHVPVPPPVTSDKLVLLPTHA
jgi:hypothetical protein